MKTSQKDPSCLWFGLNKPGGTTGADVVADLTVTAILDGSVAHWRHAANATLYPLQLMVIGVDADFRNAKTPAKPMRPLPACRPAQR